MQRAASNTVSQREEVFAAARAVLPRIHESSAVRRTVDNIAFLQRVLVWDPVANHFVDRPFDAQCFDGGFRGGGYSPGL